MSDPSLDTPNAYAPRCGHHGNPLVWLDPALRWRCPHCFPELFPDARPAPGSSSPDVTALAKQMGLADDPFFAREYQTNIYVHALMHLAEAQAARITELETALRPFLRLMEPDGGWHVLDDDVLEIDDSTALAPGEADAIRAQLDTPHQESL